MNFMRSSLLLAVALFLALFETTTFALPLTLIFIVMMTIVSVGQFPLVAGFAAGIILDFLSVGTIGISSLTFLIITMTIMLYKRKFQSNNVLFVFFAVMLSLILFLTVKNNLSFDIKSIKPAFVISIMVALFWSIAYEVWPKLS